MKTETAVKLALGVAIIGAVGYSIYLIKTKGVASIAEDAGAAAVDMAVGAVDGVVTGTVTEVSKKIGIPTPSETITDAKECRIYMDKYGKWQAMGACSAPAFFEALSL